MITRRRFLTIAASCIATPALGAVSQEWTGQAMGSAARIVLAGASAMTAARVFARVEAVLQQVEQQFSLYRDSGLIRLNRDGWLSHPDEDMLRLFDLVDLVHRATGGRFDPTIQPLWLATATGGDMTAARQLIGWNRVRRNPVEIRLDYKMQLTFNGIAQGHAADRVASLMRAEGFGGVLIDMGEIAALGQRPGGGGWRASIALPGGTIVTQTALTDRALATSSPAGTLIGAGKSHILGPRGEVPLWQLVSVSAPQAAVADALSTAFCLMPRDAIDSALEQFPQARLEALV
jgi:FAD:protein FMN transferase